MERQRRAGRVVVEPQVRPESASEPPNPYSCREGVSPAGRESVFLKSGPCLAGNPLQAVPAAEAWYQRELVVSGEPLVEWVEAVPKFASERPERPEWPVEELRPESVARRERPEPKPEGALRPKLPEPAVLPARRFGQVSPEPVWPMALQDGPMVGGWAFREWWGLERGVSPLS